MQRRSCCDGQTTACVLHCCLDGQILGAVAWLSFCTSRSLGKAPHPSHPSASPLQVPEPLEEPKAAAPSSTAAPTSTSMPQPPPPAPLHGMASLPASLGVAAATLPAPLARQAFLHLSFGAGLDLPDFELPGGAAAVAAAACAPAALFTPPSQVQQPPPPMPGAPTVPPTRQAPIMVPQVAPLVLPSTAGGALPWLTPAPASALLPPQAASGIPTTDVPGAPTVPQPLPPLEAAHRAAAAAATVAAMGPQQKAAFLARLQQLHPEVLVQLQAQRSMLLQAGGGASTGTGPGTAGMPMLGMAAVKHEVPEVAVGPRAAPGAAPLNSPCFPLLEFSSPLPAALGNVPGASLSAGALAALLGSPPSPLLPSF